MIPRLVVLWISAFAAVNCARGTISGTDDVSAGLNVAIATASRRTRIYKRLTVNVSVETAQGMMPISTARNTFAPMRKNFFGNRST